MFGAFCEHLVGVRLMNREVRLYLKRETWMDEIANFEKLPVICSMILNLMLITFDG